jgi:hypothetical protein
MFVAPLLAHGFALEIIAGLVRQVTSLPSRSPAA